MFRKIPKVDADVVIRQLIEDNIKLRTERDGFHSQLIVAQNNFEWARVRLNHVEDERSALLYRIVGMHVPAPQIERSGRQSMADTRDELISQLPQISFEDVGDEEAKKLGIDHEG